MKSDETGGVSIGPGDVLIIPDAQNDFLPGGSLAVANSDCAYKLREYAGNARRKRSGGKATWPAATQVNRHLDTQGTMRGDLLTLAQESADEKALLQLVMRSGKRVDSAQTLEIARAHAAANIAQLATSLKLLTANAQHPPAVSPGLQAIAQTVDRRPI